MAIEDPVFWEQVEGGESFAKGDVLRVILEVAMTREKGQTVNVERTVTTVLEKIPIPAKGSDQPTFL